MLPKSFNASYGDDDYETKVPRYYSQNILAQSLNKDKYERSPGFLNYKNRSGIEFKPYEKFNRNSITERVNLYSSILKYEFNEYL